jgi:hypothetical protein
MRVFNGHVNDVAILPVFILHWEGDFLETMGNSSYTDCMSIKQMCSVRRKVVWCNDTIRNMDWKLRILVRLKVRGGIPQITPVDNNGHGCSVLRELLVLVVMRRVKVMLVWVVSVSMVSSRRPRLILLPSRRSRLVTLPNRRARLLPFPLVPPPFDAVMTRRSRFRLTGFSVLVAPAAIVATTTSAPFALIPGGRITGRRYRRIFAHGE